MLGFVPCFAPINVFAEQRASCIDAAKCNQQQKYRYHYNSSSKNSHAIKQQTISMVMV